MATIQSIVYRPLDQDYDKRDDNFIRVSAPRVHLRAGHGIEGDRKAVRGSSRQLNIIPTDWLAERHAEGYRTGPGDMGEQLVVDGLAFADMAPGQRLQLGSLAVIELAQTRTGCERLDAAQPKPLSEALKHAGIGFMARVIVSGDISVGDPVTVLEAQPESGPA